MKKIRKPGVEYKLPPTSKTFRRILALDPGTTNFGIACVGVDEKLRIKVLANAVLTNPVRELAKNYKQGFTKFMAEIDRWVKAYEPQAIVAERFMTRGGGGSMGPTIECVSIMLGALTARYDMPIKLLSAATWKNDFHRRFDLDKDENGLRAIYKVCKTAPHQLDATLIGCYGLEVALRKPVIYTVPSILNMVEKTSLLRLVNRKATLEDLE